jgi:hypothetical protein
MSDGPHRSLPMRPAWRRVAERADNHAFSLSEVASAIGPAVEHDWRADVRPEFVRDIRAALEDRQQSLFKGSPSPQLESLRQRAASSMERAVLENVCALSDSDHNAVESLIDATKAVLQSRGARGARQVEEHYLRRVKAPRANQVRNRLEDAMASSDFTELSARLLTIDVRRSPPAPIKQNGLDDGVRLR